MQKVHAHHDSNMPVCSSARTQHTKANRELHMDTVSFLQLADTNQETHNSGTKHLHEQRNMWARTLPDTQTHM